MTLKDIGFVVFLGIALIGVIGLIGVMVSSEIRDWKLYKDRK